MMRWLQTICISFFLRYLSNPVRELKVSEAERRRIQAEVNRQLGGRGANLRKAGSLYAAFTGHEEIDIVKVKVPDMPRELVEIGHCDGILYTTVRDGQTEKYIHKFKRNSRPLFCVSPDGKQLVLLGGAFTFGERGIVDD
jgi:hypothetical protein